MKITRAITDWLPITKKEVEMRGWEQLDIILITGDAYVDHPSFGAAVIGRIIESEGLKVGIIPQPNWRDDLRDFKKMGTPKLFFAVTAGNMDSMINHYTASKRRRSTDAYTPGNEAGYRPDYALSIYSNILKNLYPDVPVIIGGIEGSLRRVTHYDYWSDKLLPNILEQSKADMLVYGMGEKPLRAILQLTKSGVPLDQITHVPQTSFQISRHDEVPNADIWETTLLSSHERCLRNKNAFAANFKIVEQESNKTKARRILQAVGDHMCIINPPYPPMSEKEIDGSFDLPYTRMPHPKYSKRGDISAYEMIKHSINMHRGCFGGCSFCTISAHQGKFVTSRSEESILKEVDQVTQMPNFKGYISDLGGPSANMYKLKGIDLDICDKCISPSCIHPVICTNLNTDHTPMTEIYKKVDAHPNIKKAFIGSGIRYDLLVKSYNKNANNSIDTYLDQVVNRHISGRLKVAPEHTSDATLKMMRKPSFKYFHEFKKKYETLNKKHNLNQPLIPYFISSHPGCSEEEMANLAAETKDMGFRLEQVQDFTPTPMTVATVIYYSGVHPYTARSVYTAKTPKEKKKQHQFFFWYKRENHQQLRDKLSSLGRSDLIDKLIGEKKKTQKREILKNRVNKNTKTKTKRAKSPRGKRTRR